MRRLALAVILVGAVVSCCGCSGRRGDFRKLLSSKRFPLTVRMGSLDSKWRRLTLGGAGGGELASFYGAMFGGGAYYTKGETVALAGETYLVAYTVSRKPMDFASMMRSGEPPAPPEVNADTQLGLSLINLRITGTLNDIRPFDFEEETAQQQEAYSRATEQESLSNLKNLALAVQMFAVDHDDTLPPLDGVDAAKTALNEYVRNESIFSDPGTGEPYLPNAALSGKSMAKIADPARAVVFYEAEPGEDGKRGAAFADGHASRLSQSQWEEVRESSGIR